MAYSDLGPRTSSGVIDPTRNGGNWVVDFLPQNIASNLPLIECYHMMVTGPNGSSFRVLRNTDQWGASANGYINEWDPVQPLPIRPGDTISFFWSTNVQPAPQVTIWLRTEDS